MTDTEDLIVERTDDAIVIATLNRPHARNTVSFAMWEALSRLVAELEEDSPARALIIQGAGGFFSAGGDLKVPPARGTGALAKAKRLEIGQLVLNRIQALPLPVIAAVEGSAHGVGWSIALACDLLFAGERVVFSAPFVKIGAVPDGGLAWMLTRQLGRRKAAELLLSCRPISAENAHALGLVNEVVPDGQALATALAFARSMGDGNVQAIELTKRLIHVAESCDRMASNALELAFCHLTQGGEELARARAAFIARSAGKEQV
ncbi:MAG: enoyl-CoA hydratase/isomerase family protein [Novosphingobium sp.]|nr:enoyl-CoA hydratase/isomerase family protein [Novosphingobium sp.]